MIRRTGGLKGFYRSVYPPAHNSTYVKASSEYSADYYCYFCTDPSKSLIGDGIGTSWWSAHTVTTTRLHIDLGSPVLISRIYYENVHVSGGDTDSGAKDFTFWGSNDAAAFAELTYGTDTNWTQLTLESSTFAEHSAANAVDPKYIRVVPTLGYRYYAVKISTGYEHYNALRRIELQVMY